MSHVKRYPIEPCPYTELILWGDHTIKMETVRKIFLISSLIFVTALMLWGYLQHINSYSLAWKIVTPIIINISGLTAFFSYIALALHYKIAPSYFYKTIKTS